MKKQFEINVLRLHWIKDDDVDDPKDICVHGEVLVRIGDEIISNQQSGSWSLATTALFLMRSLYNDYEPGKFQNYLLPCCGHLIIPGDSADSPVSVDGCNIGIDWTIEHSEKGIYLTSENGKTIRISKDQFQLEIHHLIEAIEQFYSQSKPKIYFTNFEKEGWTAFWNEWKKLKELHGIKTSHSQD